MTSQGHPMARFERALATNNPGIIIPAAWKLPRPILLRDGLRVLLVIRDRQPERYPARRARDGQLHGPADQQRRNPLRRAQLWDASSIHPSPHHRCRIRWRPTSRRALGSGCSPPENSTASTCTCFEHRMGSCHPDLAHARCSGSASGWPRTRAADQPAVVATRSAVRSACRFVRVRARAARRPPAPRASWRARW
jgi:hypothetical protein